jgi:hypothetical protein
LRGAAAAEVRTGTQPAAAATASFKAPLLTRILDGLGEDQRQVVLDFGPGCQTLIEQLTAKRGCRIEIADFVANGGLVAINAVPPEERVATFGSLLPRPNSERLTLIFCWDLPNYLGRQVLTSLCALLGGRAAPGCRLHMLISYSRRDMPVHPARYVPGKDSQLTQICKTAERAPAPRYSPEELSKALGGFRYERGVLLANGMQEFVYTWPDGQA